MKHFKAPRKSLTGLDAATVAQMVTAFADVALILDKKGVIRDFTIEDDELLSFGCEDWIGQQWTDVVTIESRIKVEEMLEAASGNAPVRWRQVNHPGSDGKDLPIRYSAVSLGDQGRIMAVGRDLRPTSIMQQRLVGAQSQLEREHERLREAEARYQTLFQLSTEAVIVLDAATLKITDANPAAARIVANGSQRLAGKGIFDLLEPKSLVAVRALLGDLRTSPRAKDIVVKLADASQSMSLSATMFRQDKATFYLLRLAALGAPGELNGHAHPDDSPLLEVISSLPDGFVIIGENREILMANSAFLSLAQLSGEDQARGKRIDRWLGRVEVDLDVLVANLREYGSARRFPTLLRGEFGGREEVDISGVAVLDGDPPCYGLTIRKAPPQITQIAPNAPAAPRSFEQLKELVGRVPLRDLVRETTDIIEQMCIEAALELTGDNRASAAEMLGLSRQSLYVKLRRHGMGELDGSETT